MKCTTEFHWNCSVLLLLFISIFTANKKHSLITTKKTQRNDDAFIVAFGVTFGANDGLASKPHTHTHTYKVQMLLRLIEQMQLSAFPLGCNLFSPIAYCIWTRTQQRTPLGIGLVFTFDYYNWWFIDLVIIYLSFFALARNVVLLLLFSNFTIFMSLN